MSEPVSLVEVIAAADAASAAGDLMRARDLYQHWIAAHPDDQLRFSAHYNYGLVLNNLRDWTGAKAAFQTVLEQNPDHMAARISLGFTLENLEGPFAAACEWLKIVDGNPTVTGDTQYYVTMALNQIGRLLEASKQQGQAEEILRRSLDIKIDQPEVMQHYVALRQQQCKWPIVSPWTSMYGVTRQQILGSINPLTLAIYTDDPLFHLGNAFHYSKTRIGRPPPSLAHHHVRPSEPRRRPLRIGYLSSDLRQHAVGLLTNEIYELHDRNRVEVFAYYAAHKVSNDPIHDRIRATVDHWRDIHEMSDDAAGQLILADGIDILIDLNGHTHGTRLELLARRPAPVIVNWLGYPGTMGTTYHDYLIADPFIIPPGDEIYYSETVVRLPCYQPNDRKRDAAGPLPSRAEAGLPERGMVYCAFNGQHKITPFTWRRWMEILGQVEGSVLWLLDSTAAINEQLYRLAESHGISRDRILFAPRLNNADHLARYPLADLFLDTAPYGAHTTASDAMWMGVPILTLAGRSFASRVCGSIISSAGLPELVCTSGDEYMAKAIDLGRNPEKLTALRARIAGCRDSSVLFDTPLLVRELEGLYEGMWEEYSTGTMAKPDLTNLDLYREIGLELDADWTEMLSVTDYLDRYRAKLAEYETARFVPKDARVRG